LTFLRLLLIVINNQSLGGDTMYKRIIFLMIVILSFSCSGKDPVSTPDQETERIITDFFDQDVIFPDLTDEEHATDLYFDADISEILRGPGQSNPYLEGTLWHDAEGNTWSVACALLQMGESQYGTQRIGIRFLGVGTDNMSDIIEIVDGSGDPIEGNIRLPRIAACFIDNPNGSYQGYSYRFVEVSIAYQIWDDQNQRWYIHVVRTGFEPEIHDASDWAEKTLPGSKWAEDREIAQDTFVALHGMMMPDIAYDPRNDNMPSHSRGDLYLVYTWYNPGPNTTEGDGPRVYVTYGIRHDTNMNPNDWHYTEFDWYGRTLIHHELAGEGVLAKICHGFHPRIDIGFIDYRPFDANNTPLWTVAVAFTADSGFFEPHIVTWNAGYPFLSGIEEIAISLGTAGFMPSIDIGPRDQGNPNWPNHCAVTWTQARSEDWNDVTVGYADNHGGFRLMPPHDPDWVMEAFAFPSVAVWNNSGDPDDFRSGISYLSTANPVSDNWDSWATTYNTHFDPPNLSLVTSSILETTISAVNHGSYDSGSQFSNWYGISSSMTINGNGYYWALYSAMPTPDEGLPNLNLNKVYGAYGATDY
jgi:hypothetical protein